MDLRLKEKKAPSLLRRNAGLILGLALLAVFVHDIFGDHGFLAMRRGQQEAWKVRQEIQKIDTENRQLADQVKALRTDPVAIERVAREEMGLARPGELIFKLPPKPAESSHETPAQK